MGSEDAAADPRETVARNVAGKATSAAGVGGEAREARAMGEPIGMPVDAEVHGAMVAFLGEVGQVVDELLELDLDGVAPGGRFDPGWPGEGR